MSGVPLKQTVKKYGNIEVIHGVDLFVIGGGINGAAIARDAVGRGLTVALAEQADLASGTSSASTKLIHGGLRYLEHFDFNLVRHSLSEREVLYQNMPHITWPLRFVLPIDSTVRYQMLGGKGRKPSWLVRFGLFLYDHLGGREILPPTARLELDSGFMLSPEYCFGYEYSDVWIQDSRAVALLAQDAQSRGAEIMTYTKVIQLERFADYWRITTESCEGTRIFQAKTLVNAAGAWVQEVTQGLAGVSASTEISLVKGSHIVTRRWFDHDKSYIFQGRDGRIMFAIPYEGDFTLFGTTELLHEAPDDPAECSDEEMDYICCFVSEYCAEPVTPKDVVWHFSGIRALIGDAENMTATTRDYTLFLDTEQATILSVYGGKITTHRKLAEDALAKLGCDHNAGWTKDSPLPGGDFAYQETQKLLADYSARYSFADAGWIARLFKHYGTNIPLICQDATSYADLGLEFGGGLYQAEVDYLLEYEFVRTASDILWRRTKLGLRLDAAQVAVLEDYLKG